MSLDGCVVSNIVFELNNKLKNAKVNKIYQPNDEEIIVNLRLGTNKYKLLISANAGEARIHLTEREIENPITPPDFCMLLRKHLEGSLINDICQYKMDRIVEIKFTGRDELGLIEDKSLIIEIMGKYSNIILTNNAYKILDAIKRVNFNMSSVREILPGISYNLTDISKNIDPRDESNLLDRLESFPQNKTLKSFLMASYTGISPQMTMEITFRSDLDNDRTLNTLTEEEKNRLENSFYEIFKDIRNENYSPIKIYKDDKFNDFYALDLKIYSKVNKKYEESISKILDDFYASRTLNMKLNSKTAGYEKLIRNNLKKNKKKLVNLTDELNEALDRDKYKVYADIISSNLHLIIKGETKAILQNYYDNMNEISIPLDIKLSPSQNANRYYKKYSKLKNAAKLVTEQIEETKVEITYLNSLLLNISLIETLQDAEDFKEELERANIIRARKTSKNSYKLKSQNNFLRFLYDGFNIYVGKNNKQNDYLTLKLANKDDLWFHVKEGAGSHVILRYDGREFTDEVINAAAALAGKYSDLSTSDNITIDFTKKVNVKRHPLKKLGLVVYDNFKSINIKRDNNFLQNLQEV